MTRLAMMKSSLADKSKNALSRKTRRKIVRARLRARSYSAAWRCLPDFMIIGAQRAGTSSLFKYLSRHPEIAPSLRKEVEFFNRHYGRNVRWYRAHFQLETRRNLASHLNRKSLSFEATPSYLQDPRVPSRVASLLPNVKLIVLLRDPKTRAYSGWKHMQSIGIETLPFEEALRRESARTAGELQRMTVEPLYFSKPFDRYTYLERGKYAEQLSRWFDFFPRERFLILQSETLYEQTAESFGKILDFLGLRTWIPDQFTTYGSPTSPDPIQTRSEFSHELRSWLNEYFQPHEQKLVDLLGPEFSWRDINDET